MDEKIGSKKRLGPADQPFKTTEGILAFALYLAGVQFVADGIWCKNSYTLELLRNLGFEGMDAREAAKAAVKANKRGKVEFFFAPTPTLSGLLKSFQTHEKLLNESTGEARAVFHAILTQFKSGKLELEETAILIACTVLKMRPKFMNGWSELPPHIRLMNAGEPKHSKFPFADDQGRRGTGTRVEHPGFKEFSADADDETLRRLKVI